MTDRGHDLLQTTVVVLALLTPAWLLPSGPALAWLLGVGALAAPMLWWTWHHAPWVPTPADETDRLLELLALRPGDRFLDLGAGDGRVLQRVHAATGAHCEGIEAAPLVWALGRLRLRLAGSPCVLRRGDLRTAELDGVDAVYLWGTAYGLGPDLVAWLRAGLPPGARVVSYATPLPGWDPVAIDTDGQRPLHLYQLPEPA